MHLFFDTVWKLHIGEIPEKPEPKPHYLGNAYGERRYRCLVQEYNEAIAAIKQNALTVGNPEFLESHFWCGKFEHLNLIEIPPPPDKFYFWPGGYYVDMWNAAPRDEPSEPDEVAILTLPEEKKNTMETKERIEEAAESWFQKLPWVESYKIPLIKEAHIAGATTENGLLSKEIELLRNENNYLKNRIREYIKG